MHLAISKPSVFVREQQKPSASVLLNLFPGRTLDPAQVSAIVHLVSSSVPDLPVKNVTVVDQSGNLLSSQGDGTLDAELDAGQLKYVQELEQNYVEAHRGHSHSHHGDQQRAGAGHRGRGFFAHRARRGKLQTQPASVRGGGDPQPAKLGIRHRRRASPGRCPRGACRISPPPRPARRLPQPPLQAGNPPTVASASATAAASVNTRKESTVNYEVDKTIKHVRQPVGGIKRLSVAVVVNYRKETDSAGKVSNSPLAAEEIAKINDLVKEAMGYNKDRGDTLNVANSPFSTIEREVVPERPVLETAGNIHAGEGGGQAPADCGGSAVPGAWACCVLC